jgi:hypothetical protein
LNLIRVIPAEGTRQAYAFCCPLSLHRPARTYQEATMQDTVTQMHYARQGMITDAMRACAQREGVGMGLGRRASPQAFTRSLQFQAQS